MVRVRGKRNGAKAGVEKEEGKTEVAVENLWVLAITNAAKLFVRRK